MTSAVPDMLATQDRATAPAGKTPLLRVEELVKHFPIKKGLLQRQIGHVHAVDGVSFDVAPGETLGLVGESGCGKSTVGRLVARLLTPTAGRIEVDGQDFSGFSGRALREARMHVQVIFQDPYASLNPRLKISEIVGEAYRLRNPGADWRAKVTEVLEIVGIRSDQLDRYPHQFSGGQRQRIGIARALILKPRLVVADEAVSALDVSIQAQVVNLLDRLKAEFDLSYLFISHDLSVVEHIADRIAVMYLGEIVELARDIDLYQQPLHPYTRALISAIPKPEKGAKMKRKEIVRGDVPSAISPPSGCRFHTRCPSVMPICTQRKPKFQEVRPGHFAACFLHQDVDTREPDDD